MPYGARTSLAALALCLALGIPAASAQQPGAAGTTWTDPPARKADDASKAPEAPQAAAPRPSITPAAGPKAAARSARPGKAAARREVAARKAPPEAPPVRRRVAAKPPRMQSAGTVRVHAAPARPPRMVAAVPPRGGDRPGAERIYGYRPYGYEPGYADDRFERLRSAAEAGYIVVHRRTVDFPDGRSLRVYRPADEDGALD